MTATVVSKQRLAAIIGLALVAGYVLFTSFLVGAMPYTTSGAWVVAPFLILLTVPMLARQARREKDERVLWLLLTALLVKLLGAVARYYVAYILYGGSADATGYHEAGLRVAARFLSGNFSPGPGSSPARSTNFIEVVNGAVYSITGPTLLGSFLVFAWLGFIGLFFFYRAFRIGVPEGRTRSYSILLFFLPSTLFWPSSVGKEAWMMMALGVAAYGAARVLNGNKSGLIPLALGMWLCNFVRPHIVALVGVAIVAGFLVRRSSNRIAHLAPATKLLTLAAVAAVAFVLLMNMETFFQDKARIDTGGGLATVASTVGERTAQGGSKFDAPNVFESPANLPLAIVTVLYRPLLVEASDLTQALAALEASALLLLTVLRWRSVLAALRNVRRHPYIGFCAAYTLMFIIAFSSIANFGILTRQRVQMLPFFLVLLAAAPGKRKSEETEELTPELARTK